MTYDFTEAVLNRPMMYTLQGEFTEVVAFLQGYYSGLAKSPDGLRYATEWSYFEQWVAAKLGDFGKSDPFRVLLDRYQDNALQELQGYYSEFKAGNSVEV